MKVIPNDVKQALYSIGFSRADVQIIYHLFENNLSSIKNIMTDTGLPRSSIVYTLDDLVRKNVVSIQTSGLKRLYYIDKPDTLVEYITQEEQKLREKHETLNKVLPSLKTMFAQWRDHEPIETEILRGEDGLVECFMRGLDQPRGSEILRFGTDSKHFVVRAHNRLADFYQMRKDKDIFSRLLLPYNDSADAITAQYMQKDSFREVRFYNQELYRPHCQTAIWGDCVSFTAWDEGLETIIIKNSTIAELHRQLFNIVWNQARKI